MTYSGNAAGALNAYSQVAIQAGVGVASPHRLIQMLLEAALEKIAAAKGLMANGKIPEKCEQLTTATAIVEGLRVSLDKNAGGEITANLESLYDYIERQLTLANSNNDVSILDEVTHLLRPIKEAWDAIPQDVQDAHRPSSGG
ncbi:MAG: flagellar export chaperone FliS [Gammaproteobacteria bacterium]|nr:flagellar export chaperone FliS [Gammaproteobacteria bacterium]